MSKIAIPSNDFVNAVRFKSKMTEQCSDLMHNSDKLTFSSENLDIANEIDCVDEKENLLNYPFDHMYACNSDSSELSSSNPTGESEVKQLKELLLVHLDLIQQQSEDIINKDKLINNLTRENEMLRQRLGRMERRVNNHLNNSATHSNSKSEVYSGEEMTHDTVYSESAYSEDCEDNKANIQLFDIHLPQNTLDDSVDQEEVLNEEENMVAEMHVRRSSSECILEKAVTCYSSRNILNRNRSPQLNSLSKLREELTKPILPKRSKSGDRHQHSNEINLESSSSKHVDTKSRHKNRINSRRKRLCSGTSLLSNQSSTEIKKHKIPSIKRDTVLTTEQMYYTQMGDPGATFGPAEEVPDSSLDTGTTTTTNLEVPSWRIKVFTSCYSMEGTENLDDDVFNKRHLRLENDERRRKRWDVQRIREQRHIEKLKQRQERIGSGTRTDDHLLETPASLWPAPEDIKYLEITEHLPVTAFGFPIADFTPSEFSLPWLSTNSNAITHNSTPSKKSTKKLPVRRRSKR